MGFTMSGEQLEIRTEVEIDASPIEVWEVLTDFEAYPRWNPFIAGIYGKLAAGRRIGVLMTPPEGGEMRLSPRLLVIDEARELRWVATKGASFLFRGEHFFLLHAIGHNRTRLVHGEDISGMLTRYKGGAITRLARGCVGMNQALKRRVESNRD